jgi:hypothetical protein
MRKSKASENIHGRLAMSRLFLPCWVMFSGSLLFLDYERRGGGAPWRWIAIGVMAVAVTWMSWHMRTIKRLYPDEPERSESRKQRKRRAIQEVAAAKHPRPAPPEIPRDPRWYRQLLLGTVSVIWILHTLIAWIPESFPARRDLQPFAGRIRSRDREDGDAYLEIDGDTTAKRLFSSRHFEKEVEGLVPGEEVAGVADGSLMYELRTPERDLFTYDQCVRVRQLGDRDLWIGYAMVALISLGYWAYWTVRSRRQADASPLTAPFPTPLP